MKKNGKTYLKKGKRVIIVLLQILMSLGFIGCQRMNDKPSQKMKDSMGEVLPNGIKLPEIWPPGYAVPESSQDMPVPYLEEVPPMIGIEEGRQLFIDDFLIEQTNLKRVFHHPTYHKNNPILEPNEPWEYTSSGFPYAAPFSDGVWYDEMDGKFKMWYSTGGGKFNPSEEERFYAVTAYAESDDGIKWTKPNAEIVNGTNLVDVRIRDSNTVWLDKEEKDKNKRYKLFNVERHEKDSTWRAVLRFSKDGKHWSDKVARSEPIGDRSTIFYNPFRSVWVFSLRQSTYKGDIRTRQRNYLEQADPKKLVANAHKISDYKKDSSDVKYWFGPWKNELSHPDPKYLDIAPSIYNHCGIAYESILLGFFDIWQGPSNDDCKALGVHKRNEVAIGYSRDGFHWDRPDMNRFHPVDEADSAWNFGNIQSVNGVPLIVGDSLYFYMSGRRLNTIFWDSYSSTGLATLRRDGFASMNTEGANGYLTTRTVSHNGNALFINANASGGNITAEILDENGIVVEGFSRYDCTPFTGNSTKAIIKWKGITNTTLPKIGKIRFYVSNASLYSFWFSKHKNGESGGYTAGGGPNLHPSGRDLPM